ncbi:MAG TPA: ABC transporter substrate-binding protein [Frankiaceae bacterium]
MTHPSIPRRRPARALTGLALAALLLTAAACGGSSSSSAGGAGGTSTTTPGITPTTVLIGTHQPLTGPAAPGYSKISAAMTAYFNYVNAHGGVNGRTITLKVDDDGYNPANTASVVRQLVLNDNVYAIVGGLGTPTHTAVLDFLRDNRVPDLFVASGSLSWNQPTTYPGTFGFQPDYTVEGKILADYVRTTFAGKKVCTFGQGDDFGRDGLKGVTTVLGAGGVAHSVTYTPTNTNVAPQVGELQAAGCQVVISFSVPAFTALELGTGAKLGFSPQYVVSSVGSDLTTLTGLLGPATQALTNGLVSDTYFASPTDMSSPWNQLFQQVDKEFGGNAAFDGNVQYGMGVAYVFTQALKAAGKNPTRQGIIDAVEKNGFAGPGIGPFRYSHTDHTGYGTIRIATVQNSVITNVGKALTTDDGTGPIRQSDPVISPVPSGGVPTN